jgi:hypothetical protein
LTLQENQKELKRHRDIILATIDYSSKRSDATMKIDGQNPWESNYNKLKQQTEKYFQKGKLERLQKMLAKVLEEPQGRVDLSFDNYIEEKTGYAISIFQNIKARADKIIEQNKIKNEKELHDIGCLIHILRQESGDANKIDSLHNLCRDFIKLRGKTHNSKEHNFNRRELLHIQSPNKKFRLIVAENENNGEHGMTTVSVGSKNGGASLYDVGGVNLNIKAYWVNDNKIIIESRKDYKAYSKHHQIQFSDDIIIIELIEE